MNRLTLAFALGLSLLAPVAHAAGTDDTAASLRPCGMTATASPRSPRRPPMLRP